jgi:hypothetical protein
MSLPDLTFNGSLLPAINHPIVSSLLNGDGSAPAEPTPANGQHAGCQKSQGKLDEKHPGLQSLDEAVGLCVKGGIERVRPGYLLRRYM